MEMAQAAITGNEPRAAFPLFINMRDKLYTLREWEDDASFARAAERYGRVVQGVQFSTKTGNVKTWPADLNKPLFNTENFGSFISRFDPINDHPGEERDTGGQFPIEELRDSAAALGSLTGIPDSDGIIRRHRLFTFFDGKAIPDLAIASLLASGIDGNISYDPGKKLIRWGDYTIPVDKEGKTLLRYRGDLIERYTIYFISDIFKSAESYAGKNPEFMLTKSYISPENFKDAHVFFGYYAQGLFDIFPTPIASFYPGMGVHVTMLDNMLMGDFIQEAPLWVSICIIGGLVILLVILVLFSGRISLTVASLIASLAGIIIAGLWTFNAGWWIPMFAPLAAASLAYLTATLYSFATEGKDKRFLKQAFSSVVSPKLVDQLMGDPTQLKLGGERRKMTAIFTDIQRFSSISSELQEQYGEDGPKVLVNLLNLYLTEMSNIVIENGGTVDKYEGDAIIAFFGAPIWMEDHPARACRSAILMKKQEKELIGKIMNPESEFYKPLKKLIDDNVIRKERPLYTRLGINTGDMVVGFMGTPGKMDYTIMGNAVNLSARLEGVNKQYDTKGILISEYTKEQIGDEFVVRPLSRVTVVGIPVPLRLYELLEFRSEASPELLNLVKYWEQGLKIFESKNFAEAKKYFAEISKKDPEDLAAKLYEKRCDKYLSDPPPADWDGVDNLTEK